MNKVFVVSLYDGLKSFFLITDLIVIKYLSLFLLISNNIFRLVFLLIISISLFSLFVLLIQ